MKTTIDQQIRVAHARSSIDEIIRSTNQDEAFFVCDIGRIIKQYEIWSNELSRIQPYYAVRCNNNPAILRVLSSLGANFNCTNKKEINEVLAAHIDVSRVIFNNTTKIASHIKHAANIGITKMSFDAENELYKVKKLHPNAEMLIRIKCDGNPEKDASGLFCLARDLGMNIVGVAFHVGAIGCFESALFRRCIAASRKIFDFAHSQGYQMNILNIGGGFPGDDPTLFNEIAEVINASLDEYFFDRPDVQVVAEPGRFFVRSAFTAACNVHSIRTVVREHPVSGETAIHKNYFVNDGVFGSFNCVLYESPAFKPHLTKVLQGGKYYSSSIWGPTCDAVDKIVDELSMPELNVGDWIVFEDMGDYSLTLASEYSGFPVPKVHFIIDETIWSVYKEKLFIPEDCCILEDGLPNLKLDNDDFFTVSLKLHETVYNKKFIINNQLDYSSLIK